MLAVEDEGLFLVQLPVDDLELLPETLDAPSGGAELEAELLVLDVVPAGAHPQRDPSARHVIGGDGHAREHGGVAERSGRDQ